MEIDYIKDIRYDLEQAKINLVTLNNNINLIVGRNSKESSNKNESQKSSSDKKRTNGAHRCNKLIELPKMKKQCYDTKSVFNRLSVTTSRIVDDECKRLNSRIIRELPTRQQIVDAQGTDSESRARHRRMFGSLLGTLHKFCQEETRLKQKEEKKNQIEKKIEAQEIHEREILKKERDVLLMERKQKQMEIKSLEIKFNRLKDFEAWESSMTRMKLNIKTKNKPHIFFKPRSLCKQTNKLLQECQISMEKMIETKRKNLMDEFLDMDNILKSELLYHENRSDDLKKFSQIEDEVLQIFEAGNNVKENFASEPGLISSVVVRKFKK